MNGWSWEDYQQAPQDMIEEALSVMGELSDQEALAATMAEAKRK